MSDFHVIIFDERKSLQLEIANLHGQIINLVLSESNLRASVRLLTRKPIYDSFGACVYCKNHERFGCRPDCDFVKAKELAKKSVANECASTTEVRT